MDEDTGGRKPGRPFVEEKAEVRSLRITSSQWEKIQETKKELRRRTGKSDGEIINGALNLYRKKLDELEI